MKRRRTFQILGVGFLGVAWLISLGYTWHKALLYDTTPGRSAQRIVQPPRTQFSRLSCVIVAHPFCPCTRATLKAMRQVVNTYPGQLSCTVVFAGQRPQPDCENLQLAKAIPGASIESMSAKQAREQYDAYTSGQTLVYDRDGKRLFAGGITPDRGGDDPRFALNIFKEIQKGHEKTGTYPVYGCALGD